MHSRVPHLLRLTSPDTPGLATAFRRFDAAVIDAHLTPLPDTARTSIHLDARALCATPTGHGGHGFTLAAALADADTAMATPHDAAAYGSWSAVWHYMRAWLPSLAGTPQLAQLGVDGADLPFRRTLRSMWERIAHTRRAATMHPHSSLLPRHAQLPSLYSMLIDGRLSPATDVLGGGAPAAPAAPRPRPTRSVLYDLDAIETTAHPHAHRATTAVVVSASFLGQLHAATPTGRARLVDGAARPGPGSWLRRVPASDALTLEGREFATALALDLLIMPPQFLDARRCRYCSAAGREGLVGDDGRHFVSCPHGMRRSATCHDEALAALVAVLDAALPSGTVLAERPGPGGRTAIYAWYDDLVGADGAPLLHHRPDIVLRGFDGPGTFTLIDVKTFDPAGPTAVGTLHTDRVTRAFHVALEAVRTPRQYFGPTGVVPDGLRGIVRLRTFAVSVFGSFGEQALELLQDVGRRHADRLPGALAEESTWAAAQLGPYARMRVSLAVRRALARSLRDSACTEAQAALLRAAGGGGPPIDPRQTLDGGLGLPAEDDE